MGQCRTRLMGMRNAEASRHNSSGFYAGRALGRDHDHRHPDRPVVARGAGGTGGRPPCALQNNLKQIGLALHNFESSQGTFPPGVMAKQRFSYNWDMRATGGYEWPYCLHFIMPQLEQPSYYEAIHGPQFDLQNPWYTPQIWPAVVNHLRLSTLLCPSDLPMGSLKDLPPVFSAGLQLTASNYLGIFSGLNDGDNYRLTGLDNPGNSVDRTVRAVSGYHDGTRISDIKDGTSNTMAVAEYLTGVDANDMRGWSDTNRAGCQFLYATLGPNSLRGRTACRTRIPPITRPTAAGTCQPIICLAYPAIRMPTTPVPAAVIPVASMSYSAMEASISSRTKWISKPWRSLA